MKKYKARKEREQQEAIVRPRMSIEDPSAELFSPLRSWERDDPLQDGYLEQSEVPQPTKDYHRIPKLKFRTTPHISAQYQQSLTSPKDNADDEDGSRWRHNLDSDPSLLGELPMPSDMSPFTSDVSPEEVQESSSPEAPPVPQRHPNHTRTIPIRARSLPPSRDLYQLSVSPPKTNFQVFSQRCAPSPVSSSPLASTPLFELSADEAIFSIASATDSESPVELEGDLVSPKVLCPPSLILDNKNTPESEPEASPYNRFMTFSKSIHALNANLSPIEETEEEAASRRSSLALLHELPTTAPFKPVPLSSYNGGTSITPRTQRLTISTTPEVESSPCRNNSTRSSQSTNSTNSLHSVFSFEFSNSDSEKIYISAPMGRRESAAPSLTDVSSVDDFDIDFEFELDMRRSRSASKRDTKLERFFGIRQYSVGSESDSSPTLDTTETQSFTFDVTADHHRRSVSASQSTHKRNHSTLSIDDLDLSLALENDPHRREIISMHKSILSKSQSKQDAKLEKFFGCDKDEIDFGRKSSTGSRLAGCTDDLKYRSIGW